MPATNNTKPTPSQRREKKRQHDREAQRVARDKTKKHIAHLENLVQTLQDTHSSPDLMQGLFKQLEDSKNKINGLRDALNKINKVLQSTNMASDVVSSSIQNEEEGLKTTDQNARNSTEESLLHPEHLDVFAEPIFALNQPPIDVSGDTLVPIIFDDFSNSLLTDSVGMEDITLTTEPHITDQPSPTIQHQTLSEIDTHVLPQTTTADNFVAQYTTDTSYSMIQSDIQQYLNIPEIQECAVYENNEKSMVQLASTVINSKDLDGRLWWLASVLLNHILALKDSMFTPRALDDDIAIRSCIYNWNSVEEMYKLDIGWKWLRLLDENLYSHMPPVTRFAILRVMRMQYLVQRQALNPTQSDILPDFLEARPAQLHVAHDPLVEHFVWPGLREHFLFSPNKYTTNRFINLFRESANLVWPKEPQEAYIYDLSRGLYKFSNPFLENCSKLECWQMKRDFVEEFPELRSSVPCSQLSLLGSKLPALHHNAMDEEDHQNIRQLVW